MFLCSSCITHYLFPIVSKIPSRAFDLFLPNFQHYFFISEGVIVIKLSGLGLYLDYGGNFFGLKDC